MRSKYLIRYLPSPSLIFRRNAQNSDFGRVRTYSGLHKLRKTQEKIYGTYLRNLLVIYKGHLRSIHKYLWYKIIRNTGAAFGGAPLGRPPSAAAPLGLCFWLFHIINLYGYPLCIPYVYIYIQWTEFISQIFNYLLLWIFWYF